MPPRRDGRVRQPSACAYTRRAMSSRLRHNAIRSAWVCALLALLVSIAWVGCQKRDRLVAIRQQQASGDFRGSIEPLREILHERPDDPEVNFLYGYALVHTEQETLATWALRKAMADPHWLVPAGIQLAYAALATTDYNEAIDAASKVLEREPDNTKALIARANAHAYWRQDPAQALADADHVLQVDPDEIDAMKPQILALLLLDRNDEAQKVLDEIGRRFETSDTPESAHAWYCATQAVFAEDGGDLDATKKRWDDCLAAYPTSPDVVGAAIEFYDRQADPARAVEVLRTALAKQPNAYPFRSVLAERLRRAGQVAEGEAVLREAANDDAPQAAAVWMDIGRYRRDSFDPGGAAEAMGHALELAHDQVPPQYPFEYAEALLLSQQFDRALALAEKLTLPAQRHLIRARVAQERGDFALALQEFTESFRLWPNNPWARYYAARAAEDAGDFDRAIEEYRASIRIDAGATDARTRAGALLIADGKPRYAMQLLREMGHHPLEPEGQILVLRAMGRTAGPEELNALPAAFARSGAGSPGVAVGEIARGIAEGARGPAAAVTWLRAARLDWRDLANAPALRALVSLSHEAGERATPAELRAALAKHPDSAAIQAIRGLDLELSGSVEPARAAYRRALELESENAVALAGLGRLALASDPGEALGFLDRAAGADPSDPAPMLLAARAKASGGDRDDASRRLDDLLRQHPFEAEAAALRASLDLDRSVATPSTLERARRAVRFGGGADALDLLARAHTQRGDKAEAERAAERARALREKKSPGKSETPEKKATEEDATEG
jgi:predicted Zn-dependent protease